MGFGVHFSWDFLVQTFFERGLLAADFACLITVYATRQVACLGSAGS